MPDVPMTIPWYLNPWAEVRRLRGYADFLRADAGSLMTAWREERRDGFRLAKENGELRRQIAEMRKGPELSLRSGGNAPDVREALCGCQKCTDARPGLRGWDQPGWRYACEKCGNKRCPHHQWHGFKCTGSNEPDQIGEPI